MWRWRSPSTGAASAGRDSWVSARAILPTLILYVEQRCPVGTLAVLGSPRAVFALGFAWGHCSPAGCSTPLHLLPADEGVRAIVKTGQTPSTICRGMLPIPAAALACLVYAPLATGSACG